MSIRLSLFGDILSKITNRLHMTLSRNSAIGYRRIAYYTELFYQPDEESLSKHEQTQRTQAQGRERMKLKRVEHVAIAVNDMAESIKMLQDTLGIEMEYEEKIGTTRLAMFPVGETYLELLSSNASAQDSKVTAWIEKNGQSLFHLCFEVDDIDAALDELKSKGVKLLDEEPRTGHGGSRIAFINPESTGNILIELAEIAEGH
jgi:methylmalonyl-CoA/ethylmalonyl-CoA epimerase